MRSSRERQVGGAGASEVTAAFERLGWGTVENTRHDLGTDLYVCARDERLFDLGLLVGVQVKTGETTSTRVTRYFREVVRDPGGEVTGWWFRDDDRSHIDAWLSHGLPHLIVLHDLTSRTSYCTSLQKLWYRQARARRCSCEKRTRLMTGVETPC